jgi:hypothetical protein
MQNPPFNPFEFLTTPWGKLPLGGGTSGFSPADLQELDKRISELKAVEQWLSFNHNLLKTTIQGLEVQRGTLAAIQSFTDSMTKPTPGGKAPDPGQTEPSTFSAPPPSQGGDQGAAWWDSIEQQFGQMMQAAQASAASMAEPQAKTTKKPAAKKRADDTSQP